jgi:hypothetical protein
VTLVEANPHVVRQLRDNQYRLDASQVKIIHSDAFAAAAQMPAASFDVVFLDPPFAEDWLGRRSNTRRVCHVRGSHLRRNGSSADRPGCADTGVPGDRSPGARGGGAFPSAAASPRQRRWLTWVVRPLWYARQGFAGLLRRGRNAV